MIAATLKAENGRGWATSAEAADNLVADTLTSGSHPGSNMPGRRREDDTNLVCAQTQKTIRPWMTAAGHDIVPISQDALRTGDALTPSPDAEGRVRLRDPGLGIGAEGDPAFTISATAPGAIGAAAGVRRLTPVECERLQGFPDGWTAHGPDSRRYAALGDAVTVNVAEWIGCRLMEAA